MQRLFTFLFLILLLSECHVNIPAEPAASFTVDKQTCTAPCQVSFTNSSQNAKEYRWEFGDGQTSTEANPRYTYTVAGNYTVKLIAKGDGGTVGSSKTISVTGREITGQKVWDKVFGGNFSEELGAVFPTSDGGFLLGGFSNSGISGNKGISSFGDDDFWVVRVNASGEKVWEKNYGGNASDRLRSIVATADGGFLLSGSSKSGPSGNKKSSMFGSYDFWVVKINSTGEPLWDQSFGTSGRDEIRSVSPTADGGFLLVGVFDDNTYGDSKAGIVKINASGAKQFEKSFDGGAGGYGNDEFNGAVPTTDGGFLLAGTSYGFGSNNYSEAWVVKINSTGNLLWEKAFGGNLIDELKSIVATGDGGFLLGGYSSTISGGSKSAIYYGERDWWLIKINASGEKQWDKAYGGNSNDFLYSIVPTTDGGFLLGGASYSGFSGVKSASSYGDVDYWVIKITPSGEKVRDWTFGGNSIDELRSIAPTSDGGFLLGGYSNSDFSGNKSINSNGNSDYWVIKIN